jgi:hypothetical protein
VAHETLLLGDRREPRRAPAALLDKRDAERSARARLLIRHADGAFFLRTQSIDWIEAAHKLVRIRRKHVYEQREACPDRRHLDPDQFVRVSRSAIVNTTGSGRSSPGSTEHPVLLDDDLWCRHPGHYREPPAAAWTGGP